MEKPTNGIDEKIKVDSASLLSVFIDVGGKLSALFLGIIYVCGFLTLNSHFNKYGGIDLGIGSSDYLIAGSVFVLYLVTYALFGGRAIVFMKTWMVQHIDHLKNSNAPTIAPLIVFIHSFVELAFFHCLSAAIFSTYAFGQFESFGFYAVLSSAFLVSYTLDVTKFDIKYPFAHTNIDLVIKVFAIFSFFNLSSSFMMFSVFVTFSMYSFFINIVLDTLERYKVTKDRIIYSSVFSAVFFLGSAVSFGSFMYGNISNKIGGGQSIEMEIGLNSDNLRALGKEFGSTIVGDVVHSSSENIYLVIDNKTIVLPRSTVQWMRYGAPEDQGLFKSLGIAQEENINKGETTEKPNK